MRPITLDEKEAVTKALDELEINNKGKLSVDYPK